MGKYHGIGGQGEAARGNLQLQPMGKVFHNASIKIKKLLESIRKVGLHCEEAGQADLNAEELAFLDGFSGALISAGTAADADIGIDDVLVLALGNSLNGALIGAGAALHAGIGNVKSHDVTSLWLYFLAPKGGRTFILTWIYKKAIPFLKDSYISSGGW